MDWELVQLHTLLDALTRIALSRHESTVRMREVVKQGLTYQDIAWDTDYDVLYGERFRELWRIRREDELIETLITRVGIMKPTATSKLPLKAWLAASHRESPILSLHLSQLATNGPSPRTFEDDLDGTGSCFDSTTSARSRLQSSSLTHDQLYADLVRSMLTSRPAADPEILTPSSEFVNRSGQSNTGGRVRFLYANTIKPDMDQTAKPTNPNTTDDRVYSLTKPALPLGIMQTSEGVAALPPAHRFLHVTRGLVLAREQQFLRKLVRDREVQLLQRIPVPSKPSLSEADSSNNNNNGEVQKNPSRPSSCANLVIANVIRGRKRFYASLVALVRAVEVVDIRSHSGLGARSDVARSIVSASEHDALDNLRESLRGGTEKRSALSKTLVRPSSSPIGVISARNAQSDANDSATHVAQSRTTLLHGVLAPIPTKLPQLQRRLAAGVILRAWRMHKFYRSAKRFIVERRRRRLAELEQRIALENQRINELKARVEAAKRERKMAKLRLRATLVIQRAWRRRQWRRMLVRLWLRRMSDALASGNAPFMKSVLDHHKSCHEATIVKLQSWWRGTLVRRRFSRRLTIPIAHQDCTLLGLKPNVEFRIDRDRGHFTSWFSIRRNYLFSLKPRGRLHSQHQARWSDALQVTNQAVRAAVLGSAEMARVEAEARREEMNLRAQFKAWEAKVTKEALAPNAKLPSNWVIDHTTKFNPQEPTAKPPIMYLNLTTGKSTTEHPNTKALEEWKRKEWEECCNILERRQEILEHYAELVRATMVEKKRELGRVLRTRPMHS